MADSDHSTTMPLVTNGRNPTPKRLPDSDPPVLLWRDWLRAQHVSQILCRLQQRLERRYLDARHAEAMEKQVAYLIACQAEVEATTVALKIQDKLPHIQARSLLGIVAKLEIIAGADRDIDDPTDFPWPHIASVLDDLKEIAGSLPSERPQRSVIQADCRRYQEIAADLVGVEKRVGRLDLERRPVLGIKGE